MRLKKKYVIIFLLSLVFVGIGTLVFNAVNPKPNNDEPIGDLSDPDYQNKVIEKPLTGDAFSHDYKDSLFIAIGVLRNKEYYQVETTGQNTAKTFLGNITQTLEGEKHVKKDELFYASSSHGIKSIAKQIYITPNDYIVRDAKKIDSIDNIIWKDEPTNYTKEDFLTLFGTTFFDFTQYILNDKSIIDYELEYENEDEIAITYYLDNDYAPEAFRREIKTMSDSNDLPEFLESTITVVMNKDWEILKTITYSIYNVNVFGKIKTTGETTNIFTYNTNEIPNRGYFAQYFGKDTGELITKEKTSLDYLMSAVSPLLESSHNINFEAVLSVNNHEMDLKGSININDLYILLNLDDYLYLEYSNDSWYFKYDQLIGKVSNETLDQALNFSLSPEFIEDLLASDNLDFIELKLSHKVIANSVFVTMSLDEGDIVIEINLSDNSISNIYGSLTFGNQKININAKLTKTSKVNPIDKTNAINLDETFLEIIEIINSPRFNISIDYFEIPNELMILGIDGNLFISLDNGIKIDGDINIYQNGDIHTIGITVIDDVIFLSAFDLFNFKMTFDQIPEFLEVFGEVLGIDLDLEDLQKYSEFVLDKNLFDSLSNTKLSYDEGKLLINLFFQDGFLPFDIVYQTKNIQLILPLDILININHTTETKEIVAPAKPFISFEEVIERKDLILGLIDFIQNDQFELVVNFNHDELLVSLDMVAQINPELIISLNGAITYKNIFIPFSASFDDNIIRLKVDFIEIELTIEEVLLLIDKTLNQELTLELTLDYILELASQIIFTSEEIHLPLFDYYLRYEVNNLGEITISGSNLYALLKPVTEDIEILPLAFDNPLTYKEISELLTLADNIINLVNKENHNLLFNFSIDSLYEISGAIISNGNNINISLIVLELSNNQEYEINLTIYDEIIFIEYNEFKVSISLESLLSSSKDLLTLLEIEDPILDLLLDLDFDKLIIYFMDELFNSAEELDIFTYLTSLIITEGIIEIGLFDQTIILINQTDDSLLSIEISNISFDDFNLNGLLVFNQELVNISTPIKNDYINLDGINRILESLVQQGVPLNLLIEEVREMIDSPQFNIQISKFELNNELIDLFISLDLYLDLSEDIKLDGLITLEINNKEYEIKLQILNEIIYVSLFDNFYYQVGFDEISDLIDFVQEVLELELTYEINSLDKGLIESLFDSIITYENNDLIISLFVENNFLPFDIKYQNKIITILSDPQITISHTNDKKDVVIENNNYIDVDEIISHKELFKSLISFAKSDNFEVILEINEEDLILEASILIQIRPELVLYMQGHLVYQQLELNFEASLYNGVLKIKAGNIELELTIEELLELLDDFGVDSIDFDNISFEVDDILEIINKIIITPSQINLIYEGFDINYFLSNPNQITIDNDNINILINNLPTGTNFYELELTNPIVKWQVDELLLTIDHLVELPTSQKIHYELNGVVVDKFLIDGYLKLETSQEQLNVEIHVVVTDLQDSNNRHDIFLMSLDGYTYISYNGLNIYAPTDDINKTIKMVLELIGLDISLFDSILDVDVNSFENVFAPYLPDDSSTIDILSYLKEIDIKLGQVNLVLDKDVIYNYQADNDLVITINQNKSFIESIIVTDAFVSEEDILNISLTSQSNDFEIIQPQDLSNYHHLEGISTLVEQFLKTAELKHYELSGKLNISLLGFTSLNIDNFKLKVVLDDNYKPTLVVTFTVPYFVLVTNNKTDVTLYLTDDGMIYAKQFKHKVLFGSNKTEYHTWTQEEFEADLMENILMLLNLASLPKNQIRDAINAAEGHVIKPERLLRSYKYHNEHHYNLVIVGQELNGDPNLGDININIKSNEDRYLDYFDLALNVMGSLLSISGQFNHINIGQQITIDFPNFSTNW